MCVCVERCLCIQDNDVAVLRFHTEYNRVHIAHAVEPVYNEQVGQMFCPLYRGVPYTEVLLCISANCPL